MAGAIRKDVPREDPGNEDKRFVMCCARSGKQRFWIFAFAGTTYCIAGIFISVIARPGVFDWTTIQLTGQSRGKAGA